MQGFIFYLEYPDAQAKKKSSIRRKEYNQHTGNVIAVMRDSLYYSGRLPVQSCYAAVFWTPDSPVCVDSVSFEYLRKNCKRISEALARTVHPQLFIRLEEDKEK